MGANGCGCMCMPMCYPPMMYPPWCMNPWNAWNPYQMPSVPASGNPNGNCQSPQSLDSTVSMLLSALNQYACSQSSDAVPSSTSTPALLPSNETPSSCETSVSPCSQSSLPSPAVQNSLPMICPSPPSPSQPISCLGPNWKFQAQSPQGWVEVNGKRLYLLNPAKHLPGASGQNGKWGGPSTQQWNEINEYQRRISQLQDELLKEQKQRENLYTSQRAQEEMSDRIQKDVRSQLDQFWENKLQHDALKEKEREEDRRKQEEQNKWLSLEEDLRTQERQRLIAQQNQRDAYLLDRLRHELTQTRLPYEVLN